MRWHPTHPISPTVVVVLFYYNINPAKPTSPTMMPVSSMPAVGTAAAAAPVLEAEEALDEEDDEESALEAAEVSLLVKTVAVWVVVGEVVRPSAEEVALVEAREEVGATEAVSVEAGEDDWAATRARRERRESRVGDWNCIVAAQW